MTRNSSNRQIEQRIASTLAPLGFKPSRRVRQTVLTKSVDCHSEIYLFPGVYRRKGRVLVEPVIGLDFLPLREALEKMTPIPTTQICHCFLGLLDRKESWLCLELTGETIETDALERITAALHVAFAELLPLCSAKKILEFFKDQIHHQGSITSKFVVMQEHLKLAVLEELMSEMQAGPGRSNGG
jgi:hypothetical protein